MSELPHGWAPQPCGTIAAWGSGGTPSRSEPSVLRLATFRGSKQRELGPRFVSATEESITGSEAFPSQAPNYFHAGSVAIAMYGATIGKTSILGIPATTNQACAVGIPHADATSKEYLYHFLWSQKEAFSKRARAEHNPTFRKPSSKTGRSSSPRSTEQKRIADKLDGVLARVDACRDRLDRLPALLKRFRQSILAAATSGRLTEDWRKNCATESGKVFYSRNLQRESPMASA